MSNYEKLDSLMEQMVAEQVFPSAAIAVYRDGKLELNRAYGLADPDNGLAATVHTRYDLASLTKIYAMSVLFRLIDEGRLSLDDPLSKYLPEFSGPREIREDANEKLLRDAEVVGYADAGAVTVRQLLAHASGLGNADMHCRAALVSGSDTEGDILAELLKTPFRNAPGEKLVYSNQDINLLAAAAERITGEPLDRLVARYVTGPLELTESGFLRLSEGPYDGDFASTFFCPIRGRRIKAEAHNLDSVMMDGVAGHVGVFATAENAARLVDAYRKALDEDGFISRDLARETTRLAIADASGTTRRGLLWQLRTLDPSDATFPFSEGSFGHTGWTGTFVWCDPERKLTVAILTNDIYYPQPERTLWRRRTEITNTLITLADQD